MSKGICGSVLHCQMLSALLKFYLYLKQVYMEKVIEALQTGQHALLESPTGTGMGG